MMTHHKQIKRHKHHFQLLEIMVAVFILLICIAPTLKIYISMFKEQQLTIRENQRDHLVHAIHASLIEKLYKREITLEEVLQGKQAALTDKTLQEKLDELGYQCTYAWVVVKPTLEKKQEQARKYLCQLVIHIQDKLPHPRSNFFKKKFEHQTDNEAVYDYFVYIEHGDPKQSNNPFQSPSMEHKNSAHSNPKGIEREKNQEKGGKS